MAAHRETSLIRFIAVIEGTLLTGICAPTVLDFVMARRGDGLISSAIRNDFAVWSRMPSIATTHGGIETNPACSFDRKTYIDHDANLLKPSRQSSQTR